MPLFFSMKTSNQLIELSLCVICALAPTALLTVDARQAPSVEQENTRFLDRESVSGKVSAKTEASLTVDGKTIATTAGTSFMKEGKAVTLSDVQVGDRVRIAATKTTEGSLQAVMVEVMPRGL
jgi:uncharacterized protein DUF5666